VKLIASLQTPTALTSHREESVVGALILGITREFSVVSPSKLEMLMNALFLRLPNTGMICVWGSQLAVIAAVFLLANWADG